MSYLSNFNYQIRGNSNSPRKLVFLHGLMGSLQNWNRIAQAFFETHEILLFDQRGHGKSMKPESNYAPEDYALDLYQILKELHWEQIDLVGHSMGGRNALEFAYRYPEKINHLVIEDIGPAMNHHGVSFISGLIENIPVPFASKNEARKYFNEDFKIQFPNIQNPNLLGPFFYSNLVEQTDGTLNWRFSLNAVLLSMEAGRSIERWKQVESLTMPCLWIRGAESKDLSRESFDEIMKRNPSIQGKQIEGAGHWVHSEKPEEFIQCLKSFLG